MDYESISTIVLVVIVVILMVSWLPRRTVQGMTQVIKHRSDRYSSSLHLINEADGTKFSDERALHMKGAPMASGYTGSAREREYVAQVRDLRRAAARRRRMLVGALLAISILVFVLSVVLDFNVLYTLIPIALMTIVLILGARASKQAREWEAKRAQRLREEKERKKRENKRAVEERARQQQAEQAQRAQQVEQSQDDSQTDVMEKREIRRALMQARKEQAEALARRQQVAGEQEAEATAVAEHASVDQAVHEAEEMAKNRARLVIREEEAVQADDSTNELSQINASKAPDAFDMAANQDLISFSLGSDSIDELQAVQSMEIKSTRQVAKAVPQPVSQDQEAASDTEADNSSDAADAAHANSAEGAANSEKETQTVDAVSVNDSVAFHNSEAQANVEAPDASSDSLGVDLQSILARRGN